MVTMSNGASQFIEKSVTHPDWLRVVETGKAEEVVRLANDNGFECSLEDLKAAAADLLKTDESGESKSGSDAKRINDAASGLSDLESETGYGDDTGYAALYGVAGAILKM